MQNIPVCYGFVVRDQQCSVQVKCIEPHLQQYFSVVICYSFQRDVAKVEESLAVFLPFFLSSLLISGTFMITPLWLCSEGF